MQLKNKVSIVGLHDKGLLSFYKLQSVAFTTNDEINMGITIIIGH